MAEDLTNTEQRNCAEISEELKQSIELFLSGAGAAGNSLSCVDRTRCAVVLLQSLPCARFAVLEQLCEVFHDAVQKYLVELERRHLAGFSGNPDFKDCDLDDALQTVCEVVRNFINNNASAWAPLICEWSLNLLGQLITKYSNRRGVISFTEGWHKWMSFPAIQMLMDIAAHCCASLVNSDADVCVECMLQTAMKYSPHLEWIVAHIGAHFHHIIIKKLLATALKEYTSSSATDERDKSVLISTVVQVLSYLSIQHGQEIKDNFLSLFITSLRESSSHGSNQKEHLATLPFLLHIASLSPSLVKGSVEDFIDVLSPRVLVCLFEQSEERLQHKEQSSSLISSLVNVISIINEGAFRIFVFLLQSAEPADDSGSMEFSSAQVEVQKYFVLVMELLLQRLQEITFQRHKLYTQEPEPVPLLAIPTKPDVTESSFLQELENHSTELLTMLLSSSGKRLSWLLRILTLVAVHSGEKTASQMLTHILLYGKTVDSLRLFTQLQIELEWYFPSVLSITVERCVVQLKSSLAYTRIPQIVPVLQNFLQIIQAEKNSNFPPRSKISEHLQHHYKALTKLVDSSHNEVSTKALELLFVLERPSPSSALSSASTCRSVVSFFFKLVHQLARQNKVNRDIMAQIKPCGMYMLQLAKNETCRVCLLRLLVEGILEEGNALVLRHRLSGSTKYPDSRAGPDSPVDRERSLSLLEYNRKPQISSRLPLTAASVFFTGVIGDTFRAKKNGISGGDTRTKQCESSVTGCQVWLDLLYSICLEQPSADPDTRGASTLDVKMRSTDLDFLATLLMQSVCPDVVPSVDEWPDEETLKFNIERDLKIRKMCDENPILWTVLQLIATDTMQQWGRVVANDLCVWSKTCLLLFRCPAGMIEWVQWYSVFKSSLLSEGSLCKCSPIMANLFATLMSYWEVCRDKRVTQSLEQLEATGMIIHMMAEANWLPAPLSRIGEVLHILSPKEVYTIVNTMWKVLRENPPGKVADSSRCWQQGAALKQKEVVKAIFVNNIAQLGHHYARVFQDAR